MANETAPGWVVPVMRAGYATRGATYILIGVLAALAGWAGGQAEGTEGALQTLRGSPWGIAALWAVAVGMLAYAVWRLICAWMDLENHGDGAKGLVARGGQATTGLIHIGLAVTAARLAIGSGSGGGDAPQTLASKLLTLPWGATLVMAVGAIVVGTGGYYAYKGIAGKYKSHLRNTPMAERLSPLCKAGLVAHGIVIALIGGFLIYAGMTADPSQAGGMGAAFEAVRSQPYGRILLIALALGLVAFAVYCFVEAAYRIVPRAQGGDIRSLADRAKAKAQGMAAQTL